MLRLGREEVAAVFVDVLESVVVALVVVAGEVAGVEVAVVDWIVEEDVGVLDWRVVLGNVVAMLDSGIVVSLYSYVYRMLA